MKKEHWAPKPTVDTWAMSSIHFGQPLWMEIAGKTVADFGCGTGADAIDLAKRGARRVIGIDRDETGLEAARQRAAAAGVGDRCMFTTATDIAADVVTSCDTFEHVTDLGQALEQIHGMLTPTGSLWASFGPPWRHPKGGHILSVFPWAQLVLSESALMRWRSAYRQGPPVRRFLDIGLNQMTVGRFIEIVEQSPFKLDWIELVPIRTLQGLRLENYRVTREFVTSVVKCRLLPR
jgi:ubiquinone/menaquinone biosynthesis C-methylase UbiE